MKRLEALDAGLLTALLAVALTVSDPAFAVTQPAVSGSIRNTIVAQKAAQVNLNLTVEKQLVKQNNQGQKVVNWSPLQGNVTVMPGEILRYSFVGKNVSDRAVKNLVITQPVPRQMVYLPSSAAVTGNLPAKLTYSVDNGKTFVETPTLPVKLSNGKIQNQPAPPAAYTHVRWTFLKPITPGNSVVGSFQVRVR